MRPQGLVMRPQGSVIRPHGSVIQPQGSVIRLSRLEISGSTTIVMIAWSTRHSRRKTSDSATALLPRLKLNMSWILVRRAPDVGLD